MNRRIYLASSWRNEEYADVLGALRRDGHEVYNFRNPSPNDHGFSWDECDPEWKAWTPKTFLPALRQPAAVRGFNNDKSGMDWADTCVLLLPCGRSAHLEAGFMAGAGKPVVVLLREKGFEPELMYGLCSHVVTEVDEVLTVLRQLPHTFIGGGR